MGPLDGAVTILPAIAADGATTTVGGSASTAQPVYPNQPPQQYYQQPMASNYYPVAPQGQQMDGGATPGPVQGEDQPQENIEAYLSGFKDVIGQYEKISEKTAEFNFPVDDLRYSTLKSIMQNIFTKLANRQCVMSIQVGYLLKHAYTGVLRWYYPSLNTSLNLQQFHLTLNALSKSRILSSLRQKDWENSFRNWRPSSVWVFHKVTNVRVVCNFFSAKQAPQNRLGEMAKKGS